MVRSTRNLLRFKMRRGREWCGTSSAAQRGAAQKRRSATRGSTAPATSWRRLHTDWIAGADSRHWSGRSSRRCRSGSRDAAKRATRCWQAMHLPRIWQNREEISHKATATLAKTPSLTRSSTALWAGARRGRGAAARRTGQGAHRLRRSCRRTGCPLRSGHALDWSMSLPANGAHTWIKSGRLSPGHALRARQGLCIPQPCR